MIRISVASLTLLACMHAMASTVPGAIGAPAGAGPSAAGADAVPAAAQPEAVNYAEKIHAFLLEQAAPYAGTAQINVEAPATDKLAACEQSEAFLPHGTKLRSRISVGIRCVAPQSWVAYAQANISIEGNYYVTAHALKAGTTLGPEDLSQRSGDLLRLPNGIVLDPSLLIGSITTQRLAAGATIKASALRGPESILRGQAVRLEARGAGFVATSDGKAMQNGEPGSQIQVRTASGQTVSGTVINSHTVLVLM
ncbi:flagellar basal body P-ring formation chaperone FlgA [Eoetvoesiella caeni]